MPLIIWLWKTVILIKMIAIADQKMLQSLPLREYLTDREWEEYQGKHRVKRDDWIAGRVAAKIALSNFFYNSCFVFIPLHEIEIESGKFRKPSYRTRRRLSKRINSINRKIDLSIAHTDGIGIASVSWKERSGYVGVDIEKIQTFTQKLLEDFLTNEELGYLSDNSKDEKNIMATLFWSIKESYLKACGQGLLIHPGSLVISKDNKGKFALKQEGTYMASKIQWLIFNNNYVVSQVFIT